MFTLLALLGFGILVLGFMAGCGGGGSGETPTTTTVAPTTTTTTGGGTTTTTISYRIMGTVTNAAGNPTTEVAVFIMKELTREATQLAVEAGNFSEGTFNYNLVTNEAGTYYLIACSPWHGTAQYIGGPGLTGSGTGFQPVTIEAGTLITTVESFALFPYTP